MTAIEVMRYTLMTRPTLLAMERHGEWKVVRIGSRPLYHRADVEQARQKLEQEGKRLAPPCPL